MTRETNSYLTYSDNEDIIEHRKTRSLADLPDVFMSFIYKVTNKRLETARIMVKKVLDKEASRLFRIIARDYIGTDYDPFAGEDYSTRIWKKLSPAWIKRKKSKLFWLNDGILRKWYNETKTQTVLGEPKLMPRTNPKARGWQREVISYNPYPNLSNPKIDREDIRYRLFGTNWGGDRNEQVRPVIAPAARKLINEKLYNKMMKIIQTAMEGGQYDGR